MGLRWGIGRPALSRNGLPMPERVQLSRRKGWRKPEDTVVVSKWGNQFKIGSTVWRPVDKSGFWSKESHAPTTRQDPVDAFQWSALNTLRDDPRHFDELRCKNLACWCPLDQPCHADVLLEIANEQSGGCDRRRLRRAPQTGYVAPEKSSRHGPCGGSPR